MRTVWVVEQGEYSNYHVVGVFSSKEFAQQIADAINVPNDDEYENLYEATVEEWPLDPAIHELQQGLVLYSVWMQKDGIVNAIEESTEMSDCLGGEVRLFPRELHVTVWAKDTTHAIKITNEHRTRLIAMGEWA